MPYRPPRVRPYVYDPTDDIARGFQAIEQGQDRRRRQRVEDLKYDLTLAEAIELGLEPEGVERVREEVESPGIAPDAIPQDLEYDATGAPATDTSFADAVGQIGGERARDIETPGLPPGDVRAPLGTPGGGMPGMPGFSRQPPSRNPDPGIVADQPPVQIPWGATPPINPSDPVTRRPEPRQTPGIYDEFYQFPTGTEYRPQEGGASAIDRLASAFGGDEGLAAIMSDPNIPAGVKEAIYARTRGTSGESRLTPEALMAMARERGVELDPETASFLASDPEAARDWIYQNLKSPESADGGFETAGERKSAAMQAASEYLAENPGDYQGAARHARSVVPNTAISAGEVAQTTERTRFMEDRLDRMFGPPPNPEAADARQAMLERGASPGDLRAIYREMFESGEIDEQTWNEVNAYLTGDFAPIEAFVEGMAERGIYDTGRPRR